MTTPDEAQALLPVTPELLPCPACGEQPRWRGTRSDYARGIFRLQCLGETHLFQAYGPDDKSAITAWNTRISHSLPGDVGMQEPWPGCHADLQQRRVTTLAKLGLMLSVMAGGEAAEVVGYDAAELYAEVLMALAIEDADDTDIALEEARDHPEHDCLAALTPSALSTEPVQKMHELPSAVSGDAVTVPADHPLAKGLRTSPKALDAITRQEQANIAGYLALRDFPIGSAPIDGEGE